MSSYNKLITAEELLILMEENTSHNLEFNYKMHGRFDIETIPEPECRSNFRFDKKDIPVLADVLGLPEKFCCYQGTTAKKIEALCTLLRRLAFPCHYVDIFKCLVDQWQNCV